MATFATVSDMRDTANFTRIVEESNEPVQVMKGRNRKMVVMSNDLFEQYETAGKQAAFEAKIAEAEADSAAGRTRPVAEIINDMRSKYDL